MSSTGRSLLVLAICTGCERGGVAADAALPDGAVQVCPQPAGAELHRLPCFEDLSACPEPVAGRDDDGDGVRELDGDCDDRDRHVAPGAPEVCDLRDDDCDGAVDEDGACAASARACPLSYAVVRCCGARHTIAGTFLEAAAGGDAGPLPITSGFETPYEVLVVRRDTGERRRAAVCAAPPATGEGYPFRFVLEDEGFVAPGTHYQVVVHLRWYASTVVEPRGRCMFQFPVVRTDDVTAAACFDAGTVTLSCL